MLCTAQALSITSLLAGSVLALVLACAPTPRSGAASSVRGPAVGVGPSGPQGAAGEADGVEAGAPGTSVRDDERAYDSKSERKSAYDRKSEGTSVYDSKSDYDRKSEGKSDYDGKSESKSDYDRKSDYDSKSERDSKYYDSKAYRESKSAAGERPRGAHEAPIARRDDFGPPGQETPRSVIAAYLAAADANDRQRAMELMTAKCAERERTWSRSFSVAIFDRGHRFHVVRLGEEHIEENTAEIHLRVVFLDYQGEPDNEGMRLSMVRRDGRWWLDELR